MLQMHTIAEPSSHAVLIGQWRPSHLFSRLSTNGRLDPVAPKEGTLLGLEGSRGIPFPGQCGDFGFITAQRGRLE
jgi:hypothetical protein